MITAQSVSGLRGVLVTLHRALLAHERKEYEKAFGRIHGNGAFLQLVLHSPWFNWLRPLSDLIARVDERLANKEPMPEEEAAGFVGEVRAFVAQKRYEGVMQESPEVVVAHGALTGVLPTPKGPYCE